MPLNECFSASFDHKSTHMVTGKQMRCQLAVGGKLMKHVLQVRPSGLRRGFGAAQIAAEG
jgi:hypothetical protein